MKYVKTRLVPEPTRANKTDAGIDFFVPMNIPVQDMINLNGNKPGDYQTTTDGSMHTVLIPPQGRILIPSGIHVKLPKGHALIAFNKSGIAHKTGLVVGSQVVDEGYEGEVHISLINTSNKPCMIKRGSKVVQFILTKVNYSMPNLQEIPLMELYEDSESTRGDGGFGSTDEK